MITIPAVIGRYAALAVAALCLLAAPTVARNRQEWGISVFPALEQYNLIEYYLKFNSSYTAALDEAVALGMSRSFTSKSWHEIEPRKGSYKFGDIEDTAKKYRERKLKGLFGLQIINTLKRETPDDLMYTRWNDPEMIVRVSQAVAKIWQSFGVIPVSIGNEVDVYFEKHPEEVDDYIAMFAAVQKSLRTQHPEAILGITTTWDGFLNSPARAGMIRKLNRDTDAIFFTYYPMNGLTVRAPGAPLVDLPKMTRFAEGKPVMLQEAGYPSGSLVGGSADKQAQFIADLFAAWRKEGARMPYINIFMQHDFNTRVCKDLMKYYGLEDLREPFGAFICTLGLKDSYGRPKKAWTVLQRTVSTMTAPTSGD